ncbi:hypothetical protein GCM10009541_27060 [Micromonospora gifhornensis]|uniref:VanZ like family protein n=1 Tax=Micromonospora gifhornensis TaxID=84594 RepID=A0ABQ4IM14_9ACTN|nr:hypothetical protein [Micromonospora gifhornensis]GIJ18861.1 hypothetical protein Vgi01_55450 [Micromonospora gifhornensis]
MSTAQPVPQRRTALGLPWPALLGLALLGLPRVALHDLGLVHEGTFVNLLLVVVPPMVWIVTAVVRRVPNPFLTLLVLGLIYGVLLALTHQVLWDAAFDTPPTLGGNLSDLAPGTQEVIIRVFATISSVFTGVLVGAVSGLIAWPLARRGQ